MTGDEAASFFLRILIWIVGVMATALGSVWYVASGAKSRADKAAQRVDHMRVKLDTTCQSVEEVKSEQKEMREELRDRMDTLTERIDRAIDTWGQKT